jgi:hypothetical protein
MGVMSDIDRVLSTYEDMRKAADGFVSGLMDGDELHSAVVDYTDSLPGFTVTYDDMGKIVRVRGKRSS